MHKVLRMKASVALLVLFAMLCQGTWVLAGTTGGISGTVVDASSRAGIPNAKVTAVSPSQTASVYTDARGNFNFLSLSPDTFTISVEKQGYDSYSQSGVTVFADQTAVVNVNARRSLQTIGRVAARAAADIVRPGAVTDVYSVSASQQSAASALGGGGSLTQAYSGLASVPGVQIAAGQSGWNQAVYIRGGNYTDLGYEFDGVPIQRAYDQYPASGLSALGQQELQVYVGSAPTGSQSSGLGGFINQVIKTGTYPGFATLDLAVGTPAFYHRAGIELGGATPNRNFSWYFATAGYNQQFNNMDQFNGAALSPYYGGSNSNIFNVVAANCGSGNASAGCYHNFLLSGSYPLGPNGYALGSGDMNFQNEVDDRETVVNLHFGIPHHKDGGKDDIQLLYDYSWLHTTALTSLNDWGAATSCVQSGTVTASCLAPGANALAGGSLLAPGATPFWGGIASPATPALNPLFGTSSYNYLDRMIYSGPVGAPLTAANLSATSPYYFPNSPQNRPFGAVIPATQRDTIDNHFAVFKAQYQKNMGSNAYLRVFGYSFYSDFLYNGADSIVEPFNFGPYPSDYELIAHDRGVGLQFADQLNAQNLLNFSGGYNYATTVRWNNGTPYGPTQVAALVNANNPTAGCYAVDTTTGTTAGTPTYCGNATQFDLPGYESNANVLSARTPGSTATHTTGAPTLANAGNYTCGGGPCQYFTLDSGLSGTVNNVTPRFTNFSLEDQFKPNAKLQFNVGVHYDDFRYDLADSNVPGGPQPSSVNPQARQLWTNSYNAWECGYAPQAIVVSAPSANGCSALNSPGYTYQQINFSPTSAAVNDYHAFEPRLGATYAINPLNVIRASYGKYLQPANSASQQYNTAQNNVAAFDSPSFFAYGFNNPGHTIDPEVSYNTDVSWEHQVKGTDISWKITPFLRKTQNSIYNVVLNPITNFVSSINAGSLTAQGVEFLVRKGDFDRNGFAGQISYTYTNAKIKYGTLPSGNTILSAVNNAIATYNSYTSTCAANPNLTISGRPACKNVAGVTPIDPNTGAPVVAAPCYNSDGTPNTTCGADPNTGAASIANPYWNAPAQATVDPNGSYVPFNEVPGTGVNAVSSSYSIPNVVSALFNYKHNRLSITPSLQLTAGGKYGSPVQGVGIDPASGCASLAAPVAGADPRYRYGLPAGATAANAYDASTCAASITTPNSMSGNFDAFGAYTEPSQLTANLQIAWQATKNLKFTATLANLYARCFGGSTEPWTQAVPVSPGTYGCWYGTPNGYVGNFYNPGNVIQPNVAQPYVPILGTGTAETNAGTSALPFSVYFSAQLKI